jgi:biopolymer transport protein ExbD
MGGAFGLRRPRRRPFINITSLVDVMFILLLFLMVSTTFRHPLGIEISVPEARTASEQNVDSHEIAVTREGRYFFGDRPVDEAGLREALATLLQANPKASLVLRADEGAEFGHVVRAIDIARELGGTQLVIPTRKAGSGDSVN